VEDKELLEKEMSLNQKNDFGFDPARCAELKFDPNEILTSPLTNNSIVQ